MFLSVLLIEWRFVLYLPGPGVVNVLFDKFIEVCNVKFNSLFVLLFKIPFFSSNLVLLNDLCLSTSYCPGPGLLSLFFSLGFPSIEQLIDLLKSFTLYLPGPGPIEDSLSLWIDLSFALLNVTVLFNEDLIVVSYWPTPGVSFLISTNFFSEPNLIFIILTLILF